MHRYSSRQGFTCGMKCYIVANGTRDARFNLDYINDTVAEFWKESTRRFKKDCRMLFAGFSKRTQGVGELFNNGKSNSC